MRRFGFFSEDLFKLSEIVGKESNLLDNNFIINDINRFACFDICRNRPEVFRIKSYSKEALMIRILYWVPNIAFVLQDIIPVGLIVQLAGKGLVFFICLAKAAVHLIQVELA